MLDVLIREIVCMRCPVVSAKSKRTFWVSFFSEMELCGYRARMCSMTGCVSQVMSYLGFCGRILEIPFKKRLIPGSSVRLRIIAASADRCELKVPNW